MGTWTIRSASFGKKDYVIEAETLHEGLTKQAQDIFEWCFKEQTPFWALSKLEAEWRNDIFRNDGGVEVTLHGTRKRPDTKFGESISRNVCWINAVPADLQQNLVFIPE